MTRISDTECSRLAFLDPERLLGIVTSGTLSPGNLARAAEIAGKEIADDLDSWVEDVLLWLLRHESSVVREAAIYGLESLPPSRASLEALGSAAHNDPAAGVREAAQELLADWAETAEMERRAEMYA